MSAVVGDETGLVKVVTCASEQIEKYRSQNRAQQIISLDTLSNRTVVASTAEGVLEFYHVDDSTKLHFKSAFKTEMRDFQGFRVVPTPADDDENPSTIVGYSLNGKIAVYKVFNNESTLSEGQIQSVSSFNVAGPVSSIAVSTDSIAFGGNENDLKIFDLEKNELVWEARNVPKDNLGLRVPIWHTDIKFANRVENNKIVSGTGYKHIRLYDTKAASRRPVLSIDTSQISDFRITAIQPTVGGQQVYSGDTAGEVVLWDLRSSRRVATLKSGLGSVRDLRTNSSDSVLVSVGLDRFMRVYNCNRNELVHSRYLVNRLNRCAVLWDSFERSNLRPHKRKQAPDSDVSDDEEDSVQDFEDSGDDSSCSADGDED